MINVLKLKHWQVFIGLIVSPVLSFIIVESNLHFENISSNVLGGVFSILGLILFFSWAMVVGLSLNRIKENPYHFRKGIFQIAILLSIIGYSELNIERFGAEIVHISSFITFLLMPVTFIGVIYVFKNLSQSLKSLESGEKVKFKEYILDAVLFFAFPIGIWFIQPRLNIVYKVNEMIESEEVA